MTEPAMVHALRNADFRVGPWLIQPRVNQISRDGTPRKVGCKAMDVLVYLASRWPEVVSKEEILESVWPGVFVTDSALHQTVLELRRVFGDSAHAAKLLQTIYRRGYRLLLQPKEIEGGLARQAVAVLILSPDDTPEGNLGEMVTEAVINELPHLSEWKVISGASVSRYRNHPCDPQIMGSELCADIVAIGHLRRTDERIAASCEVISPRDGSQICGARYNIPFSNAAALAHLMAVDIAVNLPSSDPS